MIIFIIDQDNYTMHQKNWCNAMQLWSAGGAGRNCLKCSCPWSIKRSAGSRIGYAITILTAHHDQHGE